MTNLIWVSIVEKLANFLSNKADIVTKKYYVCKNSTNTEPDKRADQIKKYKSR